MPGKLLIAMTYTTLSTEQSDRKSLSRDRYFVRCPPPILKSIPTDRHKRLCLSVGILSFCLLLLLLAGCGSLSRGQAVRPGSQLPASRQLTYVAIGASDSFGIGADDPYRENWPTVLAAKLGPRVHLINLGVPEMLVHRALGIELPVALDTHPNLITVWLAVNDLAANVPVDSYSHDLDLMLTRLQTAMPQARIAIGNVPDLTLVPHFSSFDQEALRQQTLAYNAAINDIVKRHHDILVDLYAHGYDLANHPEYISIDGFHPNTAGYEHLAGVFYQALQAAGVVKDLRKLSSGTGMAPDMAPTRGATTMDGPAKA